MLPQVRRAEKCHVLQWNAYLIKWRVEIIAVISFAGCFVSYLPILMNSSLLRDYSTFSHTAKSFFFQQFLLVAISISIPMMIDALLDSNLPRALMLPRWLMLLSLFIPNVIMYINSIMDFKNFVSLFFSSMHAREILYLGSLLGHYVGTYPTLRKALSVIAVMSFFTLGICVHAFRLTAIGGKTAYVFGLYMTMFAAIATVAMCLNQIILWYRRYDQYEPYTAVYIVCLLTSQLVKWFLYVLVGFHVIRKRICPYFALFTVIDAAVAIIASILPGRMAREEAAYAKHLLETKRNFVRYISHEIRTPLNTVFMGIQLAMQTIERLFHSQPVIDMMRDIQDSCSVAIDILNDLLMFDKLESGGLRLEMQVVPLKPLLLRILHQFTIQAQQAAVTYRFNDLDHFPPSMETVLIDVDVNKISQTIRNLVSNALKFTPAGGEVDVRISRCNRGADQSSNTPQKQRHVYESFEDDEEYVRIEVQDTGPGISKENQKRLFNEIIQFDADNLQNGKGSGLGLWISKSIIDMHHGVIGVESEGLPGKGSVFFVELPIVGTQNPLKECELKYDDHSGNRSSSTASTSTTISSPADNSLLPSTLRVGRILIVDDSKFNRKMMHKAVTDICDDIIEAEDGIEAVQLVQQSRLTKNAIDVILMDSIMPRMGGREATQKIRTEIGFSGVIIGVTGNVLAQDIEDFKACGANAVLGKPLQLNELFVVLESQINNNAYHKV